MRLSWVELCSTTRDPGVGTPTGIRGSHGSIPLSRANYPPKPIELCSTIKTTVDADLTLCDYSLAWSFNPGANDTVRVNDWEMSGNVGVSLWNDVLLP